MSRQRCGISYSDLFGSGWRHVHYINGTCRHEPVPGAGHPSEDDDAKYKDALRGDLSVRVGDFYEYTTTFGDVTFTTSQEVLSIDGETLTVAWEGDGGSMTITESEDEFLVGMMPLAYIAGAEEAGTETISTVAGDVVCIIYEVTEESQGTMKMWVSGSTHVMYYAEMSYNGQTMTYTLVGNSFLQEA